VLPIKIDGLWLSLARAPRSGRGGRGFESHQPDFGRWPAHRFLPRGNARRCFVLRMLKSAPFVAVRHSCPRSVLKMARDAALARSASATPLVMWGVPPPIVDGLRRVRRRMSGTPPWTCCAGRAGMRIRSEALHWRYHRMSCGGSRGSASLSLKRWVYDRAVAPTEDYPVVRSPG
jgi:hypothetical protein